MKPSTNALSAGGEQPKEYMRTAHNLLLVLTELCASHPRDTAALVYHPARSATHEGAGSGGLLACLFALMQHEKLIDISLSLLLARPAPRNPSHPL